jgi:ribonuclease Z
MSHLEQAYALDIKIRMEDEKLSPEGIEVAVEEFAIDGPVYESNGLRVIAFEVNHGDAIKPAYAYRIEYDGRVVTVSGDTQYNENVVRYGADVDFSFMRSLSSGRN